MPVNHFTENSSYLNFFYNITMNYRERKAAKLMIQLKRRGAKITGIKEKTILVFTFCFGFFNYKYIILRVIINISDY